MFSNIKAFGSNLLERTAKQAITKGSELAGNKLVTKVVHKDFQEKTPDGKEKIVKLLKQPSAEEARIQRLLLGGRYLLQ